MNQLSGDIETLALKLADAQQLPVEATIRLALQAQAQLSGVALEARKRRRMSADEMLAFGAKIASQPLLDSRSPSEILDDLNAL